jgi:plasmid stabilization system protein ParE
MKVIFSPGFVREVREFPHIGQSTAYRQTRRIVTAKYGYLIYYNVKKSGLELEIKTVVHGRQKRPYQDA